MDYTLDAASSDQYGSTVPEINTADSVHKTNKKASAEVYKDCKHQYKSQVHKFYTADSVHKTKKKAGAEVYKDCKHWDHSV